MTDEGNQIIEEVSKYKELFEWTKHTYNDDLARAVHIEEKASRYLAVLTILFGIVGIILQLDFTRFIIFQECVDYLGIFLIMLFLVSLLFAWYNSFRVLGVELYLKSQINEDTLKFFDANELKIIYIKLSEQMTNCYQENYNRINEKTNFLRRSYKFILVSLSALVILFIWMGIKSYIKNATLH